MEIPVPKALGMPPPGKGRARGAPPAAIQAPKIDTNAAGTAAHCIAHAHPMTSKGHRYPTERGEIRVDDFYRAKGMDKYAEFLVGQGYEFMSDLNNADEDGLVQ